MRIIFMGTPQFAVESLKKLYDNNFQIVGVVTSPDKPAGRGKKIKYSAVKEFALEKKLHLLQPTNLKDNDFVEELKSLKADLQIVVAFRMLPEIIWEMPRYGTINLHASLLPQYRGAAPINWAIINGEKITGNTTFFIEKEIDTGNIIFQEEIEINENDNAGTLHDKLMYSGAVLVLKTVKAIENKEIILIPQHAIIEQFKELKSAPKIFKEDCKINWNKSLVEIRNFIRGLSPYPAAWAEIVDKIENKIITAKIFDCDYEYISHNEEIGKIRTDNKNYLKVYTKEGYLTVKEIQIAGKKRLKIKEFLLGFSFDDKMFI